MSLMNNIIGIWLVLIGDLHIKEEKMCNQICNCQALSEAFRLAITYKLQEMGVLICKYILPENAFKPVITYKLCRIDILICNSSL